MDIKSSAPGKSHSCMDSHRAMMWAIMYIPATEGKDRTVMAVLLGMADFQGEFFLGIRSPSNIIFVIVIEVPLVDNNGNNTF